jgi:hypothetical protein
MLDSERIHEPSRHLRRISKAAADAQWRRAIRLLVCCARQRDHGQLSCMQGKSDRRHRLKGKASGHEPWSHRSDLRRARRRLPAALTPRRQARPQDEETTQLQASSLRRRDLERRGGTHGRILAHPSDSAGTLRPGTRR